MATSDPVRNTPRAHWRLIVLQCVPMIILGFCAVVAPAMATSAVKFFVGWLLFFGGLTGLLALLSAKGTPAFRRYPALPRAAYVRRCTLPNESCSYGSRFRAHTRSHLADDREYWR